MTDIIRALLVEPGIPARIVYIPNSFSAIADLLEGECCVKNYFDDGVVFLKNSQYPKSPDTANRVILDKKTGIHMNDLIFGAFFIAQPAKSGKLFTNMDTHFVEKYVAKFFIPDRFDLSPDGVCLNIHHVQELEIPPESASGEEKKEENNGY